MNAFEVGWRGRNHRALSLRNLKSGTHYTYTKPVRKSCHCPAIYAGRKSRPRYLPTYRHISIMMYLQWNLKDPKHTHDLSSTHYLASPGTCCLSSDVCHSRHSIGKPSPSQPRATNGAPTYKTVPSVLLTETERDDEVCTLRRTGIQIVSRPITGLLHGKCPT